MKLQTTVNGSIISSYISKIGTVKFDLDTLQFEFIFREKEGSVTFQVSFDTFIEAYQVCEDVYKSTNAYQFSHAYKTRFSDEIDEFSTWGLENSEINLTDITILMASVFPELRAILPSNKILYALLHPTEQSITEIFESDETPEEIKEYITESTRTKEDEDFVIRDLTSNKVYVYRQFLVNSSFYLSVKNQHTVRTEDNINLIDSYVEEIFSKFKKGFIDINETQFDILISELFYIGMDCAYRTKEIKQLFIAFDENLKQLFESDQDSKKIKQFNKNFDRFLCKICTQCINNQELKEILLKSIYGNDLEYLIRKFNKHIQISTTPE